MPPQTPTSPYYITTPIYYVNDRPHIGHCYTTLIADVAARAQRLIGGPDRPVFFLTGTDEHAEKVSKSAAEHGVTPMEWATTNAERFKKAFAFMNFTNDDFVRTTEARHTSRASAYIARLMEAGEIQLGDYSGWYDPSQEEYLTETAAKEADFKSPVTGKPLEQRTEQNYFFRLDKPEYTEFLLDAIAKGDRGEPGGMRILPEARKNEVLGRLKQGLQRVPVSRRIKPGDADWGIRMPGDPEHRIYVWIEALCNYLTVVDEPERRTFWPRDERSPERQRRATETSGSTVEHAPDPDSADSDAADPGRGRPGSLVVHLMAKDILWFHAVIWPCMLRALGETPPDTIYAHAYWIAEGRKMSKSLGNFIEIDTLRAYADKYSLDALRWYLTTQGPLGANDADFAHSRFVEVFNSDLANGIGNATSRVANMIEKYFDGSVPDPGGILGWNDPNIPDEGTYAGHFTASSLVPVTTPDSPRRIQIYNWPHSSGGPVLQSIIEFTSLNLVDGIRQGAGIVTLVDTYINVFSPFRLAKQLDSEALYPPLSNRHALAAILYHCAEALRIASLLLYPAMPAKMADLWRRWNCDHLTDPSDENSPFKAPLAVLAQWAGPHGLKPGQPIAKGDALFMRADPADPAPTA